MPLDFPSSPTNGQTFGQYTYDSTKGVWRVAANNATSVISSPTAPSSPVAGNVWFNTNDGSLYVYFNDGDTSQWVEMRSEVATSQVGLVPIVPTSVVVGSGTASATANAVTFSGVSSVSLNGCFSAGYSNYRIVFRAIGSVLGAAVYFRLRSSGTDRTNANHYYGGYMCRETGSGGVTSWAGNSATQFDLTRLWNGYQGTTFSSDIHTPFDSSTTSGINSMSWANDGTGGFAVTTTGLYGIVNSNDGFTLWTSSGTMSGTVLVYGYK